MAQGNGLQSLVEGFVAQLQAQITRQVEVELGARIDSFKASLLGRAAPAAARPTAARSAPAVIAAPRRGPRAGYKAEEKPCPICGTMNKARRFSYLCENHRTDENRLKFKGYKGGPVAAPKAAAPAAKASAPAAKAGPGRPPGKRGPGRPKGSTNKPKTAAPAAS